ncbi:MAG: hypothetical protein PHT20_16605, partial [Rhodoferax sp.]|nr:hypothetical protein [Rhodoferax sp.]
FGMGACQGRFCAHTTSQLAHEHGFGFDPAALNGDVPRWPLRPVSLAALAAYAEPGSESIFNRQATCHFQGEKP